MFLKSLLEGLLKHFLLLREVVGGVDAVLFFLGKDLCLLLSIHRLGFFWCRGIRVRLMKKAKSRHKVKITISITIFCSL